VAMTATEPAGGEQAANVLQATGSSRHTTTANAEAGSTIAASRLPLLWDAALGSQPGGRIRVLVPDLHGLPIGIRGEPPSPADLVFNIYDGTLERLGHKVTLEPIEAA
jgi:hypothetical protein